MNQGTLTFSEVTVAAPDGVALYYRDYGAGTEGRLPLVCLTGLTRNSKDFHRIATELSSGRRVLALDYRGRGRSGYDPDWHNYAPPTYVQDILIVLQHAGIHRCVLLGTSLGGILTMALAAGMPNLIAAAILNDVGPMVSDEGRKRIAGYVGTDLRFATYEEAAAAIKRQFGYAYPDIAEAHWRQSAQDTFVRDPASGELRLDYDLKIGDALREQVAGPVPDLWPLFAALKPIPTLAVRGALSDVLDQDTFDRMLAEKPDLMRLLIPNRGHIPLPHEEPFRSVLHEFLKSF
jgi:pimeloyl-ACP methyl ester carboxylesterase